MKKTYSIHGMHCASCVVKTEKAIQKVPGVTKVVVNIATNRATVEGDVSDTAVQRAVESIGYTAEPYVGELERTSFDPIGSKDVHAQKGGQVILKAIGMNNPHCAMIVTKVVKDVNGVTAVNVEFATEKVNVTFAAPATVEAVKKAIKEAGYEPIEIPNAKSQISNQVEDSEKQARQKESTILRQKFWVSAVLSAIVFLG
ncbi:MAG: copper ion binding protein, partial [Candidatus Yonathbacteria bacterium]|nr:copper ion binding protein [Candidatus Yonathbacteria bacterium]